MNIKSITLYTKELPVKNGPYTMSGTEDHSLQTILVKIESDSGIMAWGGEVIAAACVHIAATVRPDLLEGVWLAQPYIEEHHDPKHGVSIENGFIKVPMAAGLGIEPDESQFDLLEKFA